MDKMVMCNVTKTSYIVLENALPIFTPPPGNNW